MLTPSRLGMQVLLLWSLASLAAAFVPALLAPWLYLGAGIVLLFLFDAFLLLVQPKLRVERELPDRFALGEKGEVHLSIHNPTQWGRSVEVFDGIPVDALAPALPWIGEIPATITAHVRYPVTIPQRGEAIFSSWQVPIISVSCIVSKPYFKAAFAVSVA